MHKYIQFSSLLCSVGLSLLSVGAGVQSCLRYALHVSLLSVWELVMVAFSNAVS